MVTVGFKKLLAQANAQIETISVQDFRYVEDFPNTLIVDVRDMYERETEGAIPNSIHASRGMLEFHADPESPAYMVHFDPEQQIIVYCGTGGRSALAAKTLMDMGFPNVASLAGGYAAWQAARDD